MIATDAKRVFRSPKLGDVPYAAGDVVTFPDGLPGFEALRSFVLVTREEWRPFVFLAALERPEVALPLIPLALAAPGVAVPRREARVALGEAGDNAVPAYAVVTIGVDPPQIVANVRAPVVVNLDTRLGAQIVLADETLPLAAVLPR